MTDEPIFVEKGQKAWLEYNDQGVLYDSIAEAVIAHNNLPLKFRLIATIRVKDRTFASEEILRLYYGNSA